MAKYAPLNITPGLPLDVVAVIHLPEDRVWWTEATDFEVDCQIKETKAQSSDLVYDLAPHISKSFDGWDVILSIYMTGEDTLDIASSGYYDLVISDVGDTNARGFIVSRGNVTVCTTTSTLATGG